jgi:predicted ATP-grasp superfamily ATP-dependent carboligase
MVKVVRDMPDFRAGAAVAEALAKLAPGASCDVPALLKEAETMEKTLKRIRSEQHATVPKETFYG